MGDLIFQSGLLTFIGLIFGAIAFGLLIGYFIRRWRNADNFVPDPVSADENLYLAFSRISHHLKSSGEIVRGHLRGFTEKLPEDAERWRVARRTIFDEATQISTMVQRLDLLVRIGMTDSPLVLEPVDVTSVIEELMLGLAPAADERGILLGGIETATNGVQTLVSGDSSALREVFSNVLENAVIHCGSGAEVSASVTDSNGRLKIRIRDTGAGMNEVQLSNLFTPGGSNYVPGIRRGTGMGMYLSKMLVELHGGSMVADSKEGSGTTFEIELPHRS